jgi:hypothetical protein
MVVAPVVRGLLGIDIADGGRTLRFAPELPAAWDRVEARAVHAGREQYDLAFERAGGRAVIRITRRDSPSPTSTRIVVAPAFPLDARIRRVTVNGTVMKHEIVPIGDVQRVEVTVAAPSRSAEVVFSEDEGTEVYVEPQTIQPGADNQGLRVLRARADARALHLSVEGRGGRPYSVRVRTPHRLDAAGDVTVLPASGGWQEIQIRFAGREGDYVHREIVAPFAR